MGLTVAILQSNYIPWRGYFDIIRQADLFVLYDEVQYTKNDWRNRNIIKTSKGPIWLTIPVLHKGRFGSPISAIKVADRSWTVRHWRTIAQNYARSDEFAHASAILEELYSTAQRCETLSAVNALFLRGICDYLQIPTPLVPSESFAATGDRNQRLVAICNAAGATTYLSGPAARAYLDERLFHEHGITVRYADYSVLPPYPQLHGAFEPRASIIDLVLNTGPRAADYLSPRYRGR